ncbi:ROK family protein [Paenibacillus koleovorans]|uniref:ROK family protein n=1 Tax=Paenibacillus koleovorans TaxID=121608 RepID=UPI000FDB3C2F|nr:ROK family protein [Paenibacillus koleovorans]
MSYVIGVDIGGTNVVVGLLTGELQLVRKAKQPTGTANGADFVLGRIAGMIDALLQEEGIDRDELTAVGMGNPGIIDPERGIAVMASNMKWYDLPIAEKLSGILGGIPVFIDNDVRMYIYGEAVRGAGQGFRHVMGVTLGTGIAAAMINNGSPYYGGSFMAGEFGHIVMEGESALCGCGLRGCLETIASATGIARIARERIAAGRSSLLADWFPDEAQRAAITAADVSRAYDAGDQVAIEVMDFVGTMLAKGLSYAIPLWSPDVIIIGGGAANAGERLLAPLRRGMQGIVHPMYLDRIEIRLAEMNDDAGVVGSAAFAQARAAALPA